MFNYLYFQKLVTILSHPWCHPTKPYKTFCCHCPIIPLGTTPAPQIEINLAASNGKMSTDTNITPAGLQEPCETSAGLA